MKNFLKVSLIFSLVFLLAACGSTASTNTTEALKALPEAEVDSSSMFGVDKNININTIDEWVGRDDVAYIDMRMLIDPGDYSSIGGDPVLSGTVEGFEVVPYPFLANLTGLPETVAKTQYNGPTLFTLTWDADGKIASVTPNYEESEMVINDLFPKDKAIFLMCGGGGYAGFTRALLLELGYDPGKVYNIGGFWEYKGEHKVNVAVSYGENNAKEYNALHRLDYHVIQFDQLHEK